MQIGERCSTTRTDPCTAMTGFKSTVSVVVLLVAALSLEADSSAVSGTRGGGTEHDVRNDTGIFHRYIGPIFGANRYRQLYCRSGYHLQIFPNGTVGGTPEDHNRYAVFELIYSEGPFIVVMKGVESGLYLAMNGQGQLYGSTELNESCRFIETMTDSLFTTYASAEYPTQRNSMPLTRNKNKKDLFWFIVLDRNGKPSYMELTKPRKKRAMFLPRLVERKKVPWLSVNQTNT